MPKAVLVLSLFTLSACTPALPAEDWPQWRGPGRDGVWRPEALPLRLPDKPTPRWRRALGGGYGGIAVVGDRVYVMDRQKEPRPVERILCLDADTGEEVWAHTYPADYGKMQYGNGPRCTPTVHAGKVYTFGAVGHLFCLDAGSGKVVWGHDCVKEFKGRVPQWGHACSPLIDGERVVVQVGGAEGACLMAFDRGTGKEVWRSLDDAPGYSSPVLVPTAKGKRLCYFLPDRVVGLDRVSGKLLWSVPFPGITYGVSISDLVWAEDVLLASNYWSGSKAIRLDANGENPEVVWDGKDLSLLMSTPLVRDGHAYALDRFRGVKCIEMKTGRVRWEGLAVTPRGSNPQASLVWAGGRAVCLNARGELVLAELNPEKGTILGKVPVLDDTWAHPAYARGCVFARNDEEIVCLPLTPVSP